MHLMTRAAAAHTARTLLHGSFYIVLVAKVSLQVVI
jgi:hypothetical protein